jgi:hypothetical protein
VTKGKGYLLPPGDASEDELECCIVFYPKRDEYRRALMGSLDYLATWIAWERDSEKRGQDAAASWKLANIQTWECTNMGYCDDLYTTLQALLAATQALECCGEQDITDGERYTDPVVDGEGDVPQNIIDAGYAEDSEDWEGFADYKCMISHLAVDHIEQFFRGMGPVFNDAGIAVGGVGVVFAMLGSILALAGFPITFAIIGAVGAASAVWWWISTYGESAVEDLADEIAIHHDALTCAIYEADGVSDAISDFNDEVDSLFGAIDAAGIKAVGFEPQLRAMYSGRYDQQDIAEKLADAGYETIGYVCDCDEEEEPPPSGYHLVNAGWLNLSYVQGCSDNESALDPETGIVTLSFTVTNSDHWQHVVAITEGSPYSGGWLVHGWVMDLISYSHPIKYPSFRGANSFSPPVYVELGYFIGESWAGFNSYSHSGQDWEDWANQYDFVQGNNQNPAGSLWDSDFRRDDGTTLGEHTCVYRLRILVPD